MYGPATFREVEAERDLLWHFMRAIALKPEFAPVVDLMAIGPETHDRVARYSLALYAATLDFCALHAVTGTHWLRLIAPRTPDRAAPLRYFWQAIASLVPKIGFPDLARRRSARGLAAHAPARLARDFPRGDHS